MSLAGPVPADDAGRDAMVTAMCAAVDRGDAQDFSSWFAEDARYRFGSAPATTGRPAVIAATEYAAASLPWVHHTVDQVAHVGDQLFCRFTISTADQSGTQVNLPCVTIIWIADDSIVDYQVVMDLAPAFAAA